jgi:poly(3-hydroxybutyrate) depolymerase
VASSEIRHAEFAANPAIVERGSTAQGLQFTRKMYGAIGKPCIAEHWLVHGAGHAWSGGRSAGSFTEPNGPDASREMVRFFFSQARCHG